jgi:hypothetical protein
MAASILEMVEVVDLGLDRVWMMIAARRLTYKVSPIAMLLFCTDRTQNSTRLSPHTLLSRLLPISVISHHKLHLTPQTSKRIPFKPHSHPSDLPLHLAHNHSPFRLQHPRLDFSNLRLQLHCNLALLKSRKPERRTDLNARVFRSW